MLAMAAGTGACLGDDTITALLEGALAGDAATRARGHIAGCAACRRLVSAAIEAGPEAAPARGAATEPYTATPGPGSGVGPHGGHGGFGGHGGLAPGSVVAGKYRIEGVLGEGGMGRVYAARQTGLERPVAVKVLRPELARDAVALARFHREARLVASLMSEHVVRVHDLGALDTGEPYLVMERLDGEDLGTLVQRGALPVAQATALIAAACAALAEAHAVGIVHRDIKPSNLFLTRQQRLVVLDFGVAKLAAPSAGSLAMTRDGIVLGSPRYMAPEQISGSRDVDARADIWSLGATLYHLVTGAPPFAEASLEAIFSAILSGQPPPRIEQLPAPIGDVIRRAMARDPAARFATAGELAAALTGAPARAPRRGPRIAVVGAVLAATAGVAVAVGVARGSEERAPAPAAAASPVPAAGSAAPAPAPAPAAATAPSGAGPLGNLDETRVQSRLEQLGWRIDQIARDSFTACTHTRLVISNGTITAADVYLLRCRTPADATSEGERIRRGFRTSWVITDAGAVLVVVLPTEAASRQLADELLGAGGPAAASTPPLGLYAACFNQASRRVRATWDSYASWADPAQGPSLDARRALDGIVAINDYDAGVCLDHLDRALGSLRGGPLAGATRAYRDAFTALIGLVGEAHTYYAHEDYQDDDLARGKALHPELLARFTAWRGANADLREVWTIEHRARRADHLAAIERAQGRASERYVATALLDAAEQILEAGPGDGALAPALVAYQAAYDAMNAFFGPALTPSTDTDRYMLKQAAEALLVETKRAARALKSGRGVPAEGGGSHAAITTAHDALIEMANSLTWDGGDAGLRPVASSW
jgi:eukaryotic-like serine/threonine-protein kinase